MPGHMEQLNRFLDCLDGVERVTYFAHTVPKLGAVCTGDGVEYFLYSRAEVFDRNLLFVHHGSFLLI